MLDFITMAETRAQLGIRKTKMVVIIASDLLPAQENILDARSEVIRKENII